MKLSKNKLKQLIKEELAIILNDGKKASKTRGKPPYREQGATESQAQQMAAGMAHSCRKKSGSERDKCAAKLKKHGGAGYALYSGEITDKELRNLAKLGQKVKGHKSKEPEHRKSLPGHVTEQQTTRQCAEPKRHDQKVYFNKIGKRNWCSLATVHQNNPSADPKFKQYYPRITATLKAVANAKKLADGAQLEKISEALNEVLSLINQDMKTPWP